MALPANLSSKWFSVSEPLPHVLHVELSRKPVNAFSVEMWTEYGALLDRITREGRDVRALVYLPLCQNYLLLESTVRPPGWYILISFDLAVFK
ncbi:hypothetical protein C8R47DRAFT_469805 [Mycena vitilis]|nr:hypothetical protein C8R47DRAFT_469805 [Mycena vitilis]